MPQEKIYRKLVRDYIPQRIESDGNLPVLRTLNEEEYRKCLYQKLVEEVTEFLEEDSIEELCDILEVLEAIASVKQYTKEKIDAVKTKKQSRNGAFCKRLFLEKVMIKDETGNISINNKIMDGEIR